MSGLTTGGSHEECCPTGSTGQSSDLNISRSCPLVRISHRHTHMCCEKPRSVLQRASPTSTPGAHTPCMLSPLPNKSPKGDAWLQRSPVDVVKVNNQRRCADLACGNPTVQPHDANPQSTTSTATLATRHLLPTPSQPRSFISLDAAEHPQNSIGEMTSVNRNCSCVVSSTMLG